MLRKQYTGDWAGQDFKDRPLDGGRYVKPLFPFDYYSPIMDILQCPSTSPTEKTWCKCYISLIKHVYPTWTVDDCVPDETKAKEAFHFIVRESIGNVERKLRQQSERCRLVDEAGIVYDEPEETLSRPGDTGKHKKRWHTELGKFATANKKRTARSSSPPKDSMKDTCVKIISTVGMMISKAHQSISFAAGVSISCR